MPPGKQPEEVLQVLSNGESVLRYWVLLDTSGRRYIDP